MRTSQRESGASVIKGLHWLPCCGSVAALATLAQLAPVRVLGAMTARAILTGAPKVIAPNMAARAINAGMAACQSVISKGMVEAGAIELDQPKSAPLVVAVARLARSGAGRRKFAMKARTAGDITANAAMAGGALVVLRSLLKRAVTTVAAAFQFGMGTAQRPGRDQTLDNRLARRCRTCRKQQENYIKEPPHCQHQYMCTATMWRIAAATSSTNNGRCNRCQRRRSLS